MRYILPLTSFVLAYSIALAGDFANAKKKYVDIPKEKEPWENWIEPYDETFLPFTVCSEPKSFKVVGLKEKVDSYWDHADGVWGTITQDHGYCLFSIIKIVYNVTCLNKLQYQGEMHLFSGDKCLKSGWTHGNFSAEEDEFLENKHDWQSMSLDSLKSDGSVADYKTEFKTWKYEEKFDKARLIEQLKKQEVAYPDWKYTGDPGKKLAKPILFVHGLGDDYKTWGVTSTVDADTLCKKDATCAEMWPSLCEENFFPNTPKWLLQKATCTDELKKKFDNYKEALLRSNDDFQEGLVKKYNLGSAPDIIVRTQDVDASNKYINHNGIYFFQAPGKVENGKWTEALPMWDNENEESSQSRKLYKFLERILDDFCEGTNIEWKKTPELTIDIVAHSQGGLVVREMLRGLLAEGASSGPDNPANHIDKLVTVDTPHLGAATAAENSKSISSEYSSLGKLIDDLNAYESGHPNNNKLLNISVGLDYTNPLSYIITSAMSNVLGYLGFFASTSEYNIRMTGPYLGPYNIIFNADLVGPWNPDVYDTKIDSAKKYRELAIDTRKKGTHLDKNHSFIRNLNKGKNGNSYPKKPNGEKLKLLPLYSDSSSAVVASFLEKLGKNLKIVCPEVGDDAKEACVALENYIERKAEEMEDATFGIVDADANADEELISLLNNLVENWLINSDMIVETSSQKYEDENIGISYKVIPELEEPRSFWFHDALASWETVAHIELGKVVSSAKQGLDIACALDLYCNKLLSKKSEANLMYLENGKIDLTGDFSVVPLYVNYGMRGIRLSDAKHYLEAIHEPGVGSYVNYTDKKGSIKQEVILDASITTNPYVARKGKGVTVTFNNQSGKAFSKDFDISAFSNQISLSIMVPEGEPLPKVVAGNGMPSNQNSQIPPVSPEKWKKEKKIFAMHRESRQIHEDNTSRPRILVANNSERDIAGFKVAYYFTADPARKPVVEVDYPKIPVILENLGGDQWRFILDARDSILKAKSVFPSLDGWQIRIHYNDWTEYEHYDDWSSDFNIGIPRINKNIVIYDKNDFILWGSEPENYKSVEDNIVASPKGVLSWFDSSPWENNVFKPHVSIKNTGTVALKNYHAKLWFRVPDNKELYIPIDDWYTPVSIPTLRNMGRNVWELDLLFNEYILYPGKTVEEGNFGIHLTDWSTFDKTVCGIALVDSEENVIYGRIPTVNECLSYKAPTLLDTQYAWSY